MSNHLPLRFVRTSWQPIVIWAAAGLLLMIVATAGGFDPFSSSTWKRGDSKHYLGIAEDGYDLFVCTPGWHLMCGDAAWLPAYPWLLGAIAQLGVGAPPVGLVVSWLFSLATLLLLWHAFLRSLPARERVACTVLAAFVPGQIYHRALFPLSMLAFFSLLHLWLLWRRRYMGAGLAGAVAAASYPLGVLLLPISAAFALVRDRSATHTERVRRAALTGGLMAIGPLAVLTVMKLQTGSWDAFFQIQEKYGNGVQLSFETLREGISPLVHGPLLDLDDVPALQTSFVALTVSALVVWAVVKRHDLDEIDWLLLAATVVMWAVPLTQATVSLYRSEAVLVPAVVLLRRAPWPALVVVTTTAVLISIPMAVLFFERRII